MAIPTVPYPITDYQELMQAVQSWADRDDEEFIKQTPNFIDFAQKEIYRNLRMQFLQKEAYLSISKGQANIPSDWLETDYIITADGIQCARVATLEEFSRRRKTHTPSDGLIWCRAGNRFLFYPEITANLPNGDGSLDGSQVVLGYFFDPVRLKGNDETNYLLTIAPDLLLYKSLKHACRYIQDIATANDWDNLANTVLAEMNRQNEQMEYSGSPMEIYSSITPIS